jgi:hypothetical protein
MMMQIAMAASPFPSEPPIPPEPVPPPEPLFPPTEPPIPPPWPPHPPPAPEPPVLAAPPWRSPLAGRSGTPDPSFRGVAVDRFRIDIWSVNRSPSACRTTGSPHRHRFSLMAIRANTYGRLMCLMSDTARCCLQPVPSRSNISTPMGNLLCPRGDRSGQWRPKWTLERSGAGGRRGSRLIWTPWTS